MNLSSSAVTRVSVASARRSQLLLLAVASILSAVATAQDNSSVAEVVVTGSRIRGVAPVGSSVVSVGREDIDVSGAVTTAELVQEVPQVFNLGVSESSRGQAGGSGNITYGTSINLRGISPYGTLTILDGHRAVPQGTGAQSIDPSIIPMLALERVEIVADGASAIYGSDAVAGVVNLILRRNFEGAEARVQYGVGDDYNKRQAGAIVGHKWNTGQFTASFEHGYHDALSGRDRDFYRGDLRDRGGGDFRTSVCNPANIVIAGVSYAIPAGGVTPATAASLVPNTANRCDNLKTSDLIPEQEHNSFAYTFNQELTDSISLFADGFAARRDYIYTPAITSASLNVPRSNAYFVQPPGTSPTLASESVTYSFGDQLPVNKQEGYSKAWQTTVGAEVKLPKQWKLEALYTFGRDDELSLSQRGINTAVLNAMLASSDPTQALNPFSTAPNNPALLARLPNTIFYAPGRTIMDAQEARFDGPLFELPGGAVRAAVGFERQHLRNRTGLTSGTFAAPIVTRRNNYRTVTSSYAEVLIPVVGSANAITGIRSLELDIAGRHDKYSDVGSTTNPKFGFNWSPLEGLLLRGSYGESFRAPLFGQLYGNSSALFVQGYSDPTRGGAITMGAALSGGNVDLKPETAKTFSYGLEYEPAFLDGAKLSLTYFDIDYDNQITAYLSDLTILNREAQFAGTGVITRNPTPAQVAQLLTQYAVNGVLPNPLQLFVDGRPNNLGKTVAQGIDLQASYRFTTDVGNFGVGVNGTYFTKFDGAITPTAPLLEQRNTIYYPLTLKMRGNLSWSNNGLSAAVFLNYLNSYKNNLTAPVQTVDSYTSIDLHTGYEFDATSGWLDGLSIGLDVENAFDEEPPFVNIAESQNGGGGFDPTLTNPVGRIIALSVNKKFGW